MRFSLLLLSLTLVIANVASGAAISHVAPASLESSDKNSTADIALPSQISHQLNDTWVEEAFESLGFEPDGISEIMMAIRHPSDVVVVNRINDEAFAVSRTEFPGLRGHNDIKDGFRHAYFSLRLTQELGSDAAKQWGDAHERSNPNPPGETVMDLRNNKVGRALARVAGQGQQGAVNAVFDAISDGLIDTLPRRQRR